MYKTPSVPINMSYTFRKLEKLKSRKHIKKVFDEGAAITKFPYKLLFLGHTTHHGPTIKAGFAVPKKKIAGAVKRNRIKRLMREAYRLNKHICFNNIKGDYAFMILYLGKEVPTYDKVEHGTKLLLHSFLEKISHEKNQ